MTDDGSWTPPRRGTVRFCDCDDWELGNDGGCVGSAGGSWLAYDWNADGDGVAVGFDDLCLDVGRKNAEVEGTLWA